MRSACSVCPRSGALDARPGGRTRSPSPRRRSESTFEPRAVAWGWWTFTEGYPYFLQERGKVCGIVPHQRRSRRDRSGRGAGDRGSTAGRLVLPDPDRARQRGSRSRYLRAMADLRGEPKPQRRGRCCPRVRQVGPTAAGSGALAADRQGVAVHAAVRPGRLHGPSVRPVHASHISVPASPTRCRSAVAPRVEEPAARAARARASDRGSVVARRRRSSRRRRSEGRPRAPDVENAASRSGSGRPCVRHTTSGSADDAAATQQSSSSWCQSVIRSAVQSRQSPDAGSIKLIDPVAGLDAVPFEPPGVRLDRAGVRWPEALV